MRFDGHSCAAVDDRGPHPVAGLGQGGVGQAGHRQPRQALGEVGLHLHEGSVEPDQRDGPGAGERHQNAPCRCTRTGALPRRRTTETTSNRRSPVSGGPLLLRATGTASSRNRRALRSVTASAGSP